ncbi:UNKNOWN [Stylonychia lemnae]|uniref:Uncharacterized protein n=1 Tax=Stylonychia lemnae TaxID=5949 RepID=A0A078AYS8_STYLE|nr:UNKNOWN [Stylonychia lemnae]|eukprot:CDW87319.1 UNKNOWN [Stylonychia lemnae]
MQPFSQLSHNYNKSVIYDRSSSSATRNMKRRGRPPKDKSLNSHLAKKSSLQGNHEDIVDTDIDEDSALLSEEQSFIGLISSNLLQASSSMNNKENSIGDCQDSNEKRIHSPFMSQVYLQQQKQNISQPALAAKMRKQVQTSSQQIEASLSQSSQGQEQLPKKRGRKKGSKNQDKKISGKTKDQKEDQLQSSQDTLSQEGNRKQKGIQAQAIRKRSNNNSPQSKSSSIPSKLYVSQNNSALINKKQSKSYRFSDEIMINTTTKDSKGYGYNYSQGQKLSLSQLLSRIKPTNFNSYSPQSSSSAIQERSNSGTDEESECKYNLNQASSYQNSSSEEQKYQVVVPKHPNKFSKMIKNRTRVFRNQKIDTLSQQKMEEEGLYQSCSDDENETINQIDQPIDIKEQFLMSQSQGTNMEVNVQISKKRKIDEISCHDGIDYHQIVDKCTNQPKRVRINDVVDYWGFKRNTKKDMDIQVRAQTIYNKYLQPKRSCLKRDMPDHAGQVSYDLSDADFQNYGTFHTYESQVSQIERRMRNFDIQDLLNSSNEGDLSPYRYNLNLDCSFESDDNQNQNFLDNGPQTLTIHSQTNSAIMNTNEPTDFHFPNYIQRSYQNHQIELKECPIDYWKANCQKAYDITEDQVRTFQELPEDMIQPTTAGFQYLELLRLETEGEVLFANLNQQIPDQSIRAASLSSGNSDIIQFQSESFSESVKRTRRMQEGLYSAQKSIYDSKIVQDDDDYSRDKYEISSVKGNFQDV